MGLSRYDPFRQMEAMRDAMDRFLDEGLLRRRNMVNLALSDSALVPLDLYEEGNNLIVKASLPGVKPEEVKVDVRGDVLTISGERKQETERKETDYHLHERAYSHFERSVVLPAPIQTEKAQAVFEDGVLTLTLPKTIEAQSKSIPVTASSAKSAPKPPETKP